MLLPILPINLILGVLSTPPKAKDTVSLDYLSVPEKAVALQHLLLDLLLKGISGLKIGQ